MKHSLKKFVHDFKVDFDLDQKNNSEKKIDFNKYDQAFIKTVDKEVIQGFLYMNNGNPIVIAEPDPCLLYFTQAEKNILEILELKSEILQPFEMKNSHRVTECFFTFFQLTSSSLINFFASIEALNNSLIPNGFTIRIKRKLYDKTKTQRFLTFNTKTEEVIPEIFKKSFALEFPEKYQLIQKMKTLRDNVIHTKNHSKGFSASYRDIFREYLDFDYEEAYKITKDYINYYKPNWIENCDCGK